MSVEGDLFRVTVKGSRESVVKMMNAALKSFDSDKVIVESDDIDTMNSKLEMFTGKEGKNIGIPDLLGQVNDTHVYRNLELVRIEDAAPGLIAKFSYYLSEAAYYYEEDDDKVDESVDWDTVALHYNCQVFLDDDWYINGQFLRFGEATIYDASDGEIRKIYLNSGSKYDAEEYPFFLKALAHLYPDHYGVDWDHYHSKHPEVEISEDECLAWFNAQKQPWDQEELSGTEDESWPPANDPQYPIDENGHTEIPEGTTDIGDLAFNECPGLVSVTIPDSVNWVGAGAFSGCTNLKSIKASGVRVIDSFAFEGCSKLSSVEITSPDLDIFGGAFKDCSALVDVVLPKIADIADDAFEGCPCENKVMKIRYIEFKTVKQMTDEVKRLIEYRELGFREKRDGRALVYHTKKFKEKIIFEYRNNKIFYTISAHNTSYESWTIHQEKVLKNFIKLYESTK